MVVLIFGRDFVSEAFCVHIGLKKYPYPLHRRFFELAFETPLPLEISNDLPGVGMDIFWNHTNCMHLSAAIPSRQCLLSMNQEQVPKW